ncbi:MAG: alkaline phosphatase family protein [Nitrososphaerales archaeon]|nr:alkaline phosphatase family protein [Nitrososphaerales archaeon]
MDTISHVYGPYSEETLAELRSFFYSYKTAFLDKLNRDVAKETLLMVTADHGQSEASKENAIFASDYPELMNRLWIPPTGDSRAVFLYAKPGEIDEVKDYVDAKLRDRLFILDSDRAIEEGLFGVGLDKKMIKERVGDLIMLSYSNNSFAYRHRGLEKDFTMKGAHGGMSEDEMLVPFICKKLRP